MMRITNPLNRLPAFRSSIVVPLTAVVLTALALTSCSRPAVTANGDTLTARVAGGAFHVSAADLSVTFTGTKASQPVAVTAGISDLGTPRIETHADRPVGGLHVDFPSRGLHAFIASGKFGVELTLVSDRDQSIAWPVTGAAPAAGAAHAAAQTTNGAPATNGAPVANGVAAYVLPDGEGLLVPADDAFWIKRLTSDGQGTIPLLPFWGVVLAQAAGGEQSPEPSVLSYVFPGDHRLSWQFGTDGSRLTVAARNDFHAGDPTAYRVTISPPQPGVLSPAFTYRAMLQAAGDYRTLADKVRTNAEVSKLFGAFHVWAYGTGMTTAFVHNLAAAGIDRAWLGYYLPDNGRLTSDQKAFVRAAAGSGYLVGPYDTWSNVQNAATADDPSSVWPNGIWPSGCVEGADHQPVPGFHDRGCYLSSQALLQREPTEHNIADRLDANTADGQNGYFLDVDATNDLFDDYTPAHPMTVEQDAQNKLARLQMISGTRKLVLGSEDGAPWAATAIAFDNGSFSTGLEGYWAFTRDRAVFGGYWPPDEPRIFFKAVDLPDDLVRSMYDPRYRIPLYEAVLHGSVISTDRPEAHLLKFPNVLRRKELFLTLYDVPPIMTLDEKTLGRDAAMLSKFYAFWSPLHRAAAESPLTSFGWLTPDHLVQQTHFGDSLTVTANFGETAYHSGGTDVPAGCVDAQLGDDAPHRQYCP